MTTFWRAAKGVATVAGIAAAVYVSVSLVHAYTAVDRAASGGGFYSFSELLIDYDGGFVRRGLLGAVLKHRATGPSRLPLAEAIVFTNFCLLTLLTVVLSAVSRGRTLVRTLLLLCMPGGLLGMALSDGFFFRKEVFFYTALMASGVAVALALQAKGALGRVLGAVAVVLLAIFGVVLPLVHEGFLFLAAPASALLLFAAVRAAGGRTMLPVAEDGASRRWVTAYLLLEGAMFLLASVFKGGVRTSTAILNGLSPEDRALVQAPDAMVGNAITQMSLGLKHSVGQSVHQLIDGMAWYWLVPMVGVLLYCMALVVLDKRRSADTGVAEPAGAGMPWVRCFAALALWTVPIFVLGCDWGRWIVAIATSFVVVWLAVDEHNLGVDALPGMRRTLQWLGERMMAASGAVRAFERGVRRRPGVAIGVMLVFGLTFRLPEVCIGNCYGKWAATLVLHTGAGLVHTHHVVITPLPATN